MLILPDLSGQEATIRTIVLRRSPELLGDEPPAVDPRQRSVDVNGDQSKGERRDRFPLPAASTSQQDPTYPEKEQGRRSKGEGPKQGRHLRRKE